MRTADVLARLSEDLLKAYDLTGTSYNVLRILRGAGDEGLPCGEIGARLLTRDPDVTRLVDRLERRGLVIRRRGTSDRRVVRVVITPAGAQLLEAIGMDQRVESVHTPHFAALTPQQITTLIDLLETLRGPETASPE